MLVVKFADLCVFCYFFFFSFGFMVNPNFAKQFGIDWTGKAGKTEVRTYYGALSFGLSMFLVLMMVKNLWIYGLDLSLILASSIFISRLIGTAVDKGWKEDYTKLALPVEFLFVLLLGGARVIG